MTKNLLCKTILLLLFVVTSSVLFGYTPTPTVTPTPVIPCRGCMTPPPTQTPLPEEFRNNCFFSVERFDALYPIDSYTFQIITDRGFEADEYSWEITNDLPWLMLDKTKGTTKAGYVTSVTATVNWSMVNPSNSRYNNIFLKGQSNTGNYYFESSMRIVVEYPNMTPLPTPMCTPMPFVIKGQVTDGVSGLPIAGATIVMREKVHEETPVYIYNTITDSEGFYEIVAHAACNAKNTRISAKATGYKSLLLESEPNTYDINIHFTLEKQASVLTNLTPDGIIKVSSEYSTNYPGKNAGDGNDATLWGSKMSNTPEWIYVDLKETKKVKSVAIKWFDTFYARAYKVAVSNDGINWTFVATITNGNGGIDEYTGDGNVRYIGLYMTKKNNVAYAVKEIEIMGYK